MKTGILVAALVLAVGAPPTNAQASLSPQDILVVTDAGLFWLAPNSGLAATRLLDQTAFGVLSQPSIEWIRGTDDVVVASSQTLSRVTVIGNPPKGANVTDITPGLAVGGTSLFFDVDINPASGELYLLDRGNGLVHRFQPPFSQGMLPDLQISVPKSARSLCVDSRRYPTAIIYGWTSEVTRHVVETGVTKTVTQIYSTNGIDIDPAIGNGALISKSSSDKIAMSTSSPNLVVDINLYGFCLPVALTPRDVEWDPVKRRLHALAEDGINPCFGSYLGDNHVVRFPVPLGPFPPVVVTPPSGSGILGKQGDLTIVQGDFSFGHLYGPACGSPRLDYANGYGGVPAVGNTLFQLEVTGAPPLAPVWLVAGLTKIKSPFAGCSLLAQPTVLAALPQTDSAGELIVPAPIPNQPALLGADVYLQAILQAPGGQLELTPGLGLHLGI